MLEYKEKNAKSVKRFIDVFLGSVGIFLATPVLLIFYLLILLFLGRPVWFRQKRLGGNGTLFTIWKFRTMTEIRDPGGNLLPDSARLTRLGRFLRATSLDELPELFNVLRGEMSLVGPRPLLPQYLERYNPEQRRRMEVLPGITGWAQVNGRNSLSWEERFSLDVWYVDNRNILFDMKILLLTVFRVFQGRGISAPGKATMGEFLGMDNTKK